MHLSTQQKYWLFSFVIVLTALYMFEPTSGIGFVQTIMNAKIGVMPFLAVKNLVIVLLVYMWWKIFEAGR